MMKVICNICLEESKDQDFGFKASIMEISNNVLIGESLQPQKQGKETLIHICKKCFNEHLVKLIKYER